MRSLFGVRGAGQDAQGRIKRAAEAMSTAKRLEGLMPQDPFAPFLSPEQIRLAAMEDPNGRRAGLVRDVIRRRHMAALVTLAEWQPGMDTDALVEAAGRVKELLELEASLEEIEEEVRGKK